MYNYAYSGDAAPPKGGKRAPVVFCLDVTKSMLWPMDNSSGGGKTRIKLANEMIATFCKHILSVPKAADTVEVAFVLFAHKTMLETEFVNVTRINLEMFDHARKADGCGTYELHEVRVEVREENMPPYYRTGRVPEFTVAQDKGTKLDSAVIYCYEKIEALKQFYIQKGVQFYAPHFVLITDGDPDDQNNSGRERDTASIHQEAVNLAYDHSWTGRDGTNLIVPITVGIFDDKIDAAARSRVADYGKNFPDGYYPIEDGRAAVEFKKAAEFLCKTVVKSLYLGEQDSRSGDAMFPDPADPRGKNAGYGQNVREIYSL